MSNGTSPPKHINRLALESSPYLLQHAHNPVDWYAWGPEAFEQSRKQNKPIFLSVGYSTCYWCHVMERQSFENEAVAAEMNRRFINIKVDREERPDVDQLYMTAVQILTGQGGWPMSVFLMPDLRPFYGGTYFPPADGGGRPGFVTILRRLEEVYRNQPRDIDTSAERITEVLRQHAVPPAPQEPIQIDEAFVEGLIRRSASDYDPKFGGFGGAPKFPRQTLLELLLVYLQSPPFGDYPSRVLKMLRGTLDSLANGGIRDHLGGAFHRYSTDARWLVPHFEIMLYDNAMLAWCYVEAFAQTGQTRYAEVARGIFDFVLREMTSPQGGFYTALDAEVDGKEGLNYLWTPAEIEAVLGPEDAEFFNKVYGVDRGPNFADPHHGTGVPDKNILYLSLAPAEIATQLKTDPASLEARIAPMRHALYQSRLKRKQPILDTKIITSWNALMIRALAHGAKVLGDQRYLNAAQLAAGFLLNVHRALDGGLFRTSRDGIARYDAFLDDYAFLAQALLDLNRVARSGADPTETPPAAPARAVSVGTWKDHAIEISRQMQSRFMDPEIGGFYFTEKDAPDLIVRQKVASDSPLPSGNAVAAMVLMELDQLPAARRAVAVFTPAMESHGEGMSSMVQAALLYLRKAGTFTVAAAVASEKTPPASMDSAARDVVNVVAEWVTPTELRLRLHIASGFYINAHKVPTPLIATRIAVDDGVEFEADYPPGEALRVAFMDEPFNVYDGQATITLRFARMPTQQVKVSLTYQACNESACLKPVTKQIAAGKSG